MIKNYLDYAIEKVICVDDHDLNFLKWFISYQYNHYPATVLKKRMFSSLLERKIICEKDYPMLSNEKCAEFITDYAINVIPRNIEGHRASDYEILLYVYVSTGAFSPVDSNDEFANNDFNISDSKEKLELLQVPAEEDIDIERYYHSNGATYELRGLRLEDRIALFLYFLLADVCTISKYNLKITALTEDGDGVLIKDIDKILEKCKRSASRYDYFFLKERTLTHERIESVFKHYLEALPESALAFAPSLFTIIFNSLQPNVVKKMDNTEYEIFSYNDLIFPLNMEPSDMTDFQLSWWNNSAFLKMILLPVAGRGGNAARDIEIRFREKLDKALKYWKKVNVIGDKDFEGWEEEQKQEFWLHAMVECDFCFSTPYFDIFRYIYDNQELFVSKKGNHMDAALSILHLNAFTKWYDALLLMENMPLSFRNFQFFYLKMLSIYPEFQDVVEAASNIS